MPMLWLSEEPTWNLGWLYLTSELKEMLIVGLETFSESITYYIFSALLQYNQEIKKYSVQQDVW